MGMYTQVRGWLNVDSISYDKDYGSKNYLEIKYILDNAKLDFMKSDIPRSWVCKHTTLHVGGNGSVFLFIGTELKNYGNPTLEWLKFLIKRFPNAEGSVDFQYEEDEYSTTYFIREGQIRGITQCPHASKGYGNIYDINK